VVATAHTPGAPKAPRAARIKRIGERQEALAGLALVAVPMALFLILNIGSILYAMFISVWRWNVRTGPVEFKGIDNYTRVLSDPIFQSAIGNTVYYTLIWVPLTMAIGLFLAIIVNQKIRGQTFFRGAFYFPSIASSAAITTLWIFIVSPYGLFNEARGALGFNPVFSALGFEPNQDWLGDYRTAMNSVIILNAWTTSGTFMLFYLASLQAIPHEVYEAAAIDGAGAWQTFRRITFPLLRPGHFFVATVGVIGGLQLFDQSFIAGGPDGNPANSLMTMVLYLYNRAFKRVSFGEAAAVGVILFLVIFGATLLQRWFFESRHQQDTA
jgi:multiple sugar transport system permease protein